MLILGRGEDELSAFLHDFTFRISGAIRTPIIGSLSGKSGTSHLTPKLTRRWERTPRFGSELAVRVNPRPCFRELTLDV